MIFTCNFNLNLLSYLGNNFTCFAPKTAFHKNKIRVFGSVYNYLVNSVL